MAEDKNEYSESYVNWLKEELESLRRVNDIYSRAFTTAKQVIIHWDWDRMYEFPEGRSRPVKLHELVQEAIKQNYRVVSVFIEEYDDTFNHLHAHIIALAPGNGNLH